MTYHDEEELKKYEQGRVIAHYHLEGEVSISTIVSAIEYPRSKVVGRVVIRGEVKKVKKCSRCGVWKYVSDFHSESTGKFSSQNACIECQAKYHSVRYSTKITEIELINPETGGIMSYEIKRSTAGNWFSKAVNGYQLGNPNLKTSTERLVSAAKHFEALWNAQGGLCPLLQVPLKFSTCSENNSHVDHNHTTGNVRGILSHLGNKLEGFVKADSSLSESPILRAFSEQLKNYLDHPPNDLIDVTQLPTE